MPLILFWLWKVCMYKGLFCISTPWRAQCQVVDPLGCPSGDGHALSFTARSATIELVRLAQTHRRSHDSHARKHLGGRGVHAPGPARSTRRPQLRLA